MKPLDLSSIALPEDVANLPVSPDMTPDEETPPAAEVTPVVEIPPETPPLETLEENPPVTENPPIDASTPPSTEETPKENVPFHEHPDWKKMQAQADEAAARAAAAEAKAAELEAKLNQQNTPPPTPDPYEGMSAAQRAEARLREAQKNGEFEPADQLQLNAKFAELLTEEQTKDKEKEDAAQEQRRQAYEKEQEEFKQGVEAALEAGGVTDTADMEAVLKKVTEWGQSGMKITPKTVEIAINNLELAGVIKKKPDAETPESKAANEEEAKRKAAANSKISKPSSTDPKPTTSTAVIKNGAKMSLDQLTHALAEQLPQG